ncbi:MAG: bifunctional 3-(3-hydroxy-phenyl)propionate/3-hydroxycinnamic acid hydroxylase [Acidobacteriota bacterium]|nr:bifunctional 3-(3-hydroxy-phenyl)propionate/3-hydroxycinnamic acid hydroxylase [Acidobacteriota bacterium]
MEFDRPEETEVLIVGAGPVGLLLANLLGLYGVAAIVVEQMDRLIDYPRGVGLDDESLRSFQAVDLADRILPYTTPNHWMRFTTAKGRAYVSIEPHTLEYGWPRRNAFLQPKADAISLEGLERFPGVQVLFSHGVTGLVQDSTGVSTEVTVTGGVSRRIRSRYVVGADGGRSAVRKGLGVDFVGQTESTRWLVVDLADDPVGAPYAYLHGTPGRPSVSIALPMGVRRFEFMLLPHEEEETFNDPAALAQLLRGSVPRPEAVRVIRKRAYTHHARLASRFRVGRALLAGDAAHLMPVWQGQGFNSGIRDATNLGWKLAAVVKGLAEDALLDTYEQERRGHAAAMIDLSVNAGRLFSPTVPALAALRDVLARVLNLAPPVKRYVTQMRFKPQPRYTTGAFLPDKDGRTKGKARSPVGRMFVQPMVRTLEGATVRLDDVLGPWFAIVCWGGDPRSYFDRATGDYWASVGARFVTVLPAVQLAATSWLADDLTIVGDVGGTLQTWFGDREHTIVILRPDRFVAATCGPQTTIETTRGLAERLCTPFPAAHAAAAEERAELCR